MNKIQGEEFVKGLQQQPIVSSSEFVDLKKENLCN